MSENTTLNGALAMKFRSSLLDRRSKKPETQGHVQKTVKMTEAGNSRT